MASGVYCIRNKISGRVYVGSSLRLEHRRLTHFRLLRNGNHHCRHMQNSVNKHGIENFIFLVLEKCGSLEECRNRENHWIQQLRACDRRYGYNIRPDAVIPVHSEETKRLISKIQKGRKLTEEWKSAISAANKGKKKPAGFGLVLSKHYAFFSNKAKLERMLNLRESGKSSIELAKIFKCSKTTILRTLKGYRLCAAATDPIPSNLRKTGQYIKGRQSEKTLPQDVIDKVISERNQKKLWKEVARIAGCHECTARRIYKRNKGGAYAI